MLGCKLRIEIILNALFYRRAKVRPHQSEQPPQFSPHRESMLKMHQYYEGALALGATHERSIFTVIIPAAKSGVIAGIVLGIGRAIGETMAVIMIVGNQPRLVSNMLLGMRTLTGNIVIEMGYATGLHREALIATGVVLFVFILIINFSVALLKRRGEHE